MVDSLLKIKMAVYAKRKPPPTISIKGKGIPMKITMGKMVLCPFA